MRKKDIVLMATVSSFEGLPMPGKTEQKQFADLFVPLFQQSGDEARRMAVAALSQCDALPRNVCQFIASQPIAIAAPFLATSPALDDQTLIDIARAMGPDHARAIAARPDLSVSVVDALVNMHDGHEIARPAPAAGAAADAPPAPATAAPTASGRAAKGRREAPGPVALSEAREQRRAASEDLLRQDLKAAAMRAGPPLDAEAKGLRETQMALLVRFARQRQAMEFATCLADMIGSTLWLAERIMLDLSGEQLAQTLKACGVEGSDALYCLIRFYPHLAAHHVGMSRAMRLWEDTDPVAASDRLAAWLRADHYSLSGETADAEPANLNRKLAEAITPIAPRLAPAPRERRRVKAGSRVL